MTLFALIPLMAALPQTEAEPAFKKNDVDLMYTFSKVSVKGLPKSKDLYTDAVDNQNYSLKTVNISYGWGNQGTLVYTRTLKDPDYCFKSALTYLHAGNTYHKILPIGSLKSFSLGKTADVLPQYVYQRDQINYYELDLFMQASLSRFKHANFSVWGGLITSWFQVSELTRSGLDFDPGNDELERRDEYDSKVYKNYFLGPNLKIDLVCPFFKDHFYVGLKAGLGFMMNFRTILYSYTRQVNNYTTSKISFLQQKDNSHNNFMFCPQVDLEASLGYRVNHFKIEAGLSQFFLVINLLNDRFGSLTFGGPYIKAGYEF